MSLERCSDFYKCSEVTEFLHVVSVQLHKLFYSKLFQLVCALFSRNKIINNFEFPSSFLCNPFAQGETEEIFYSCEQ